MGKARRALENEEKKLNIVKVIIVILVLVVMIVGLLWVFNNESKDESQNDNIDNKFDKQLTNEQKLDTIDSILENFGGTVREQVKDDTYYVNKDGKDYTVYLDGDIVEGTIIPWTGNSAQPAVDAAGNINIYSAAELKWVADQVINGEKNFSGITITLRNNIDLGARKNNQGIWEGSNWTAIVGFLDELPEKQEEKKNTIDKTNETQTTEATKISEISADLEGITNENLKRFAGTFDGNGFWIKGMKIETDKRYQGLFGYQTGTIRNVTIKNSNIKGGEGTGAIVGLNGGIVLSCKVENTIISGTEKTGGIVGISLTNSRIENSTVNAEEILADKYIGGIAGYMNNNSIITNCINQARVTGNTYIGGITGIIFYGTTITNSSNRGEMFGKEYIGGIAGYSQAQIEKCYNQGSIQGENYVAGITGLNYLMGNIISSYNNGKIIAKDNCGGIARIK